MAIVFFFIYIYIHNVYSYSRTLYTRIESVMSHTNGLKFSLNASRYGNGTPEDYETTTKLLLRLRYLNRSIKADVLDGTGNTYVAPGKKFVTQQRPRDGLR